MAALLSHALWSLSGRGELPLPHIRPPSMYGKSCNGREGTSAASCQWKPVEATPEGGAVEVGCEGGGLRLTKGSTWQLRETRRADAAEAG